MNERRAFHALLCLNVAIARVRRAALFVCVFNFVRDCMAAGRCIAYLKEKMEKPMTFLPLDTIRASPPDDQLRAIPGAKLAVDLIDFDKKDQKVMWFVTGNVVVVNSLEDAKKLAFHSGPSVPKCKIVTLDASVISKTGAMTGGDTSHLTSNAQRWQRQEFDKLKEQAEVTPPLISPLPGAEGPLSASGMLGSCVTFSSSGFAAGPRKGADLHSTQDRAFLQAKDRADAKQGQRVARGRPS